MSGTGFRGRGFGPRSNRPQKPHGGFSGPHANFNQNRRPPNHQTFHQGQNFNQNQNFNQGQNFNQNRRPDGRRPPGQDVWRDNSAQSPGRFNRHSGNGSHYNQGHNQNHNQGHSQGHQRHYYNNRPGGYHDRGRGFHPGRFPGRPGRDFDREAVRDRPRYSREDKRNFIDEFQEPLLGSEEERQQKISKTVDKLKQTLSSFTEEDSINFWEDNFSPPSPGSDDPSTSTSRKGIPELRHGPPELDLTFNDFKVIGRVDLDTSLKSDSVIAVNEEGNSVFNGANESAKTGGQEPQNEIFTEDCLFLNDPQEEEFISQLDTRLADYGITASSSTEVLEFNNQDQPPAEVDESGKFLASEEIISEFQIAERSDLLCENNSNLQFDIDPSFAENIGDSAQNELSNFNDGTIFDPTIEPNFEEPIESTEVATVSFEETHIDEQRILETDLQQNLQPDLQQNLQDDLQQEFAFDKSENIQEIQTEIQQLEQLTPDSVQLFTVFQTAEPPSEILQEESNSNLPFGQQESLDIEAASILENQSFDQTQIRESHQIFDSNEALPGLSQQESNLFFEELGQMEGNFPESEQEFFKPKENEESKESEKEDMQTDSAIPENNQKSLFENSEAVEPQPLQPPPIFKLNLMKEYSENSRSSKSHKQPLQPPPMFDPMEAFPDLLRDCEESSSSFPSHNLQEKPLRPPPMFELGEPPDFMQDCEDAKSNSSIKRSRKLDHREESQHSNSSFDQQKHLSQEEILQPPPAFDPRGPPPSLTIIGEDRSFKTPGFLTQDEVIQPPKVFDPRLSSQQRMDFVSTGPEIIPAWTGPMGDYNMASNFVPPIHVSPMTQPGFISNVGYNMVIPPLTSVPIEFPPPLPQENQMAPPLPAEAVPAAPLVLSMDDELGDMQEAMEFAKQLMNMTESNGEKTGEELKREKKSRKKDEKNKEKHKESKREEKRKKEKKVEYGPAFLPEMIEERKEVDEQSLGNKTPYDEVQVPDNEEEGVVVDDQIRPKVVFNLNKVKRICKVDEWQQQQGLEESEDLKGKKKKFLKDKEKLEKEKENQVSENQVQDEKTEDERRRRRRRSKDRKDENRLSREEKTFGRIEEKASTSRTEEKPSIIEESKKEKKEQGSSENQESWKNRVIKQFLKMDRNDFHNMINNTSRRRFDIAMKQLVKERKTSLSQEMRNTEEEKVRHFDRDQFMTQLNQMLDPEASESVDISNLPTEFIQHLSMVLHLDPMPRGAEEGGGEIEMMDSGDFLQQMCLENKNHRTQEQPLQEEEYQHLPNESSPTSVQPVVEKKKRHHEKKVHVQVIRVKEPINQGEPLEVGSSRTSKESQKTSRERENGEATTFKNAVREPQSREVQLREAQLRDDQIREQQAKDLQIRDQHFREQQIRDQQFKEQQQQIREQHIREQQMRETREAKVREAKAREAKLAQIREQELREAEIREGEIRELQKKQIQLRAQLAREMFIGGTSTLDSESPPHLTSVLDDIFKPGLSKGKPDRGEARTKPSRSETVTKPPGKYPTLGTMERTLDDIFSAGIAKAKASLKTSAEPSLEQQQQWTRKKRENVDTFRNLTKEEWEAKHGRSMSDTFEKEFNALMLRRTEAETLHSKGKEVRAVEMNDRSQKKTYQWDETPLPERINDEGANRLLVRHKENLEEGELTESNDDSDNDSSSSSSTSSDSASSENIAPDVTKLLKVIKEREKVAKKKSLNEAIRDEVAADIEKRKREKERHKERKSRKRKKREKKGKKKKKTKKHKKKAKRNSNSGSDKEVPEKLLTEEEIKKEVKTEPITPEEKKVEKKLKAAAVINKSSLPAIRTLGNSPAKVNVDYGQKSQLTKTKAQLKQMPENSSVLVETAVQVENTVSVVAAVQVEASVQVEAAMQVEDSVPDEVTVPFLPTVAKACSYKLNAETQTQIPDRNSEAEKQKCERTGGEHKEDEVENKNEEKEKEKEKEKVENLEKATSDIKIPESLTETPMEVEKKWENHQKSSEGAEPFSVTEEKIMVVPKETQQDKLPETTSLVEKKPKTPTKSQGTVREKKPNRIDIQAYKARTLERKKKEQEKFKELAQNPISLTTNLLNIPLANKPRTLESLKPKTNPKIKEPKTLEIQKPTGKDSKQNERIKSPTILRDPRLASKAVLEKNTTPVKISVDKLDPNKNKVKDSPDESKFKFIKSEGGKELKLKNKPKSSKKIKNQSTALVVIEQKIESPLRRSSISSESDYSQGSSNLKTLKTIEDSKRKEKIELTKKNYNLHREKKSDDVSKDKDTEVFKEKPIKDSKDKDTEVCKEKPIKDFKDKDTEVSKEKPIKDFKDKDTEVAKEKPIKDSKDKDTEVSKEKPIKDSKDKDTEVSKEKPIKDSKDAKDKIEKPFKPVRKLKIYGKKNETITKTAKIEETAKVQKLISDGLPDTVPSEEISKYYTMELENYPSLLQDLIEDPVDVCPAKEVFFGNMIIKEDYISVMKPNFEIEDEKKHLDMEEINPIENIIFDGVDLDLQESNVYSDINSCHEKPELFQFGIEDNDPNLRLVSTELPPILNEQEIALPLTEEPEEKLNPLSNITETLIEHLSVSESENFLIRDNLGLKIQSPDYSKNGPEQNIQDLFEPVEHLNKVPDLENRIENFEIPAIVDAPSISSHVVVVESRETEDLIQLIEDSSHVALVDLQVKSSDEGEKIVPQVEGECAHPDLFTSAASRDKRSRADDNKESHFSEPISLEKDSEPIASFISVLDSGFAESLKDLVAETETHEHSNSNFEVKLNKPKKISEVVLQTGVTIVRPEKNDFEARIASEKSVSASEHESESGKQNIQCPNSGDSFEVRNFETESGNSKQDVDMGVRHLNLKRANKNLHKVKHKRKMKNKKEKKMKAEVKQAIKEIVKPVTTLSLLERMKEIDNEIQKLMGEKTKLYEKMAEMEQKAKSSENGDLSSKENFEVNGKKQKKSSPEDDEVAFFSKENSKQNLKLPSKDEETFSEKKSKKLTKTERSQKLKKSFPDSSSEDEEIARFSKEKPKNLTKRVMKNLGSSDSDFENLPLDQLKKQAKSHSIRKIKSSSEEEKEEIKEIEKKGKKKRPKSVMKVLNSSDEEKKVKKTPKRPKSVMLFSKEKSSDEEKKAKKEILKRPKSAMKLKSVVTDSSEGNSGDEEVAVLNKKKSQKIATDAMQMRPKSAMKLSSSKLILSSEDEEKHDKDKEKVVEKRKRPRSVMMKSSPVREESDEEIKKKKLKETPLLNTEQKIFVKIKGKHERERSKKKEKIEKKEEKLENEKVEEKETAEKKIEKEDKKKMEIPFVQVNRLDHLLKKKTDSPEAKKVEKEKDKIKKANSISPKKKEDFERKKVRALDSALIYSDESTLETLEPSKDNKLKKNTTGLALLEQSFRKEMAEARKAKAEEKKKILKTDKKNENEIPKSDKIEKNQKLVEDNKKIQISDTQNDESPATEKSPELDLSSDIPGPKDQTPCKGFDVLSQMEEMEVSLEVQRSEDPKQQVAKNLFTEINEDESLNQEVQRINSTIDDEPVNAYPVEENPIDENLREKEKLEEFSQPSLKEFSDKDSNKSELERSALMSPISDDSTLSGDSIKRRKRPTGSLSQAGKIPTRRSSKHQESEEEEKRSRASSRQRRGSQTPVADSEPPKKKRRISSEKFSEKVLYSKIKDLLKLEMRPRRKDRKKRKCTREEMESCRVKLLDLKHTYLRQELPQGILKRLGLSRINLPTGESRNLLKNSTLLQEKIMKVQEIKRISIDENLEGSGNETTFYIFKMDGGKKLEAVKGTDEKKEDNEVKMKEDQVEEKKKEEKIVSKQKEVEEKTVGKQKEVEEKVVAKQKEVEEKAVAKQKEVEEKAVGKQKEVEEKAVGKQKEVEEKAVGKQKEIEEKTSGEDLIEKGNNETVNEMMEVEGNPSGEVTMEVPGEADIITNGPDIEEVKRVKNLVETQEENRDENQVVNLEDTEIEIPNIHYTVHKGPILDIKIIGDSFLAASEDGAIYRYSLTSNGILNIYKGHSQAVTCLYVLNPDPSNSNRRWMYSGSLDGSMRCYDIGTGEQMQSPIAMGSAVQCMDQAWGAIFIGTTSGHVARYHIKAAALKGDRIQFSNKSVLALKATSEGPRKVLIVASRNQPIMIRDAFTGLFLRQISGQRNYTVYSLLRHNSLIYFGTSSTSIPVYDFITGEQKVQYNAGVGVVCMYLYERLLFAGCYDGNIYIFDIREKKLVCSIPGPGKMLLSMAIVNKRIIAGSKDKSLHCWEMPKQAQELLDENT